MFKTGTNATCIGRHCGEEANTQTLQRGQRGLDELTAFHRRHRLKATDRSEERGIRDVFFVVCDGLNGLPDTVNAVFLLATVQTCIIHLIRGSFLYASRKYWDKISHDLKSIYTAPTG